MLLVDRKAPIQRQPSEDALRARIGELVALWAVSGFSDAITVRFSTRMTRSVGRADCVRGRISLAAWLQNDPRSLDIALCHEVAHLVAFHLVGRSERAHGLTWQRLMREAGCEPTIRLPLGSGSAFEARAQQRTRYRHACPICDFVRIAGRRVPGWRCADCVGAGLDGLLEIERVGRGH